MKIFEPSLIGHSGPHRTYSVLVCGKRATGKTSTLKYLVEGTRDRFDAVHVFTRSPGEWDPQKATVHEELDDLDGVMKEQKRRVCHARENNEVIPAMVIVLDNVVDSRSSYDEALHALIFTNRHYNIQVLAASSYVKVWQHGMAQQFDWMLVMAGSSMWYQHDWMKRHMLSLVPDVDPLLKENGEKPSQTGDFLALYLQYGPHRESPVYWGRAEL
jgi:hypothetical protein